MINFVKQKLASYLIDRKLEHKEKSGLRFTNFFSSSFSFFVIMPEDEKDFHHSFEILNFLDVNRKNQIIFTYDFRVSLLPLKFRQSVLVRGISDVNKLNLPTKNIENKLSEMIFDVSIDLNRPENLYCSYLSNMTNAEIRIGFAKSGSDKYYNLQIAGNEDNPDISYKNLLNCLSMF